MFSKPWGGEANIDVPSTAFVAAYSPVSILNSLVINDNDDSERYVEARINEVWGQMRVSY